MFDLLTGTDTTLFYAGVLLMALAPALLGAFLGAPLVARELEAGTYRLAWTQSVSRRRWLASKLTLTVGAAAFALGAASLAVTWWSAPLDGAVSQTRGGLPEPLDPGDVRHAWRRPRRLRRVRCGPRGHRRRGPAPDPARRWR